jgi:hypothetical protein
MTDEQQLEDAKQPAARIRARLDHDRLRTIEGKATEIEDRALGSIARGREMSISDLFQVEQKSGRRQNKAEKRL